MLPEEAADARAAWLRKYRLEPAPWRGTARLPPAVASALAALSPDARVLEVGAGGGKTLAAARRATRARVVALDWAPPTAPDAAWALADARALPFRDAAFDAVLLVHVLGHLPRAERERAAREAWRVLAPGGVVHAEVFARGDLREGKGESAGEPASFLRDGGILYHYFDEAEARALFPVEGEVRVLAEAERHRGVEHERRRIEGTWWRPAPRDAESGV